MKIQASPTPQRQTSVSSILARASSIGSGGSGGSGPTRQSSQTSLFDQFTHSAKELIKERQTSQESSFLQQVDKVSHCNINIRTISLISSFISSEMRAFQCSGLTLETTGVTIVRYATIQKL